MLSRRLVTLQGKGSQMHPSYPGLAELLQHQSHRKHEVVVQHSVTSSPDTQNSWDRWGKRSWLKWRGLMAGCAPVYLTHLIYKSVLWFLAKFPFRIYYNQRRCEICRHFTASYLVTKAFHALAEMWAQLFSFSGVKKKVHIRWVHGMFSVALL